MLAVASAAGIAAVSVPAGGFGAAAAAQVSTPVATTVAPTSPTAAVGAWSAGVLHAFPGRANVEFVDLYAAGPIAVLARVGLPFTGHRYPTAFAVVAADGTVGALRRPALDVIGGPAFDSRGRGIVAVALAGDGIGWATIDRAGVVGVAHRLGNAIFGARVAMNPSGDLVMAWIDRNTPRVDRETGGSRLRVRVAVRPAGKAFRATETLPLSPTIGNSEQIDPSFTAAIGTGGRLVVAVAELPADAPNRMVAWTGTARTGLGSRQTVGRQASDTTVSAAITAKGGVVLAWSTQSRGEETDSGLRVRAAAKAPRASHFGAMKELDPGGPKERAAGKVQIVPGPDGGALLVWDNLRAAGSYDVSTATVGASGRIGARRTIATDAVGVRTAIGPRGRAAVTWSQGANAARGIYRAPGQPDFGPTEAVPPGYGQLLFWPHTHRLTAAALQIPEDKSEGDVLELATRSDQPSQ